MRAEKEGGKKGRSVAGLAREIAPRLRNWSERDTSL